jgi:hypothetical protein
MQCHILVHYLLDAKVIRIGGFVQARTSFVFVHKFSVEKATVLK